MLKEVFDGGNFTGKKSTPQKGCGTTGGILDGFPLPKNGGGDYFCLDLVPGAGGFYGQVIMFFHDMNDRPRLAKSYAAWLAKLAAGLESGGYMLDEDDGIVKSADDDEDS